jgi:hypothetical protein
MGWLHACAPALVFLAAVAATHPMIADEQCRWEKCDFPMMQAGKPLSAICACYRSQCNDPAATPECACEEALVHAGKAIDKAGNEAGRMNITVSPDVLPAKPGESATINVDVDLSGVNTEGDASFRVDVSSGQVSEPSFWITGKKGSGPTITYTTAEAPEPGDVMLRVYGGWSVILLGQSTGEVYEGKVCFRLE